MAALSSGRQGRGERLFRRLDDEAGGAEIGIAAAERNRVGDGFGKIHQRVAEAGPIELPNLFERIHRASRAARAAHWERLAEQMVSACLKSRNSVEGPPGEAR